MDKQLTEEQVKKLFAFCLKNEIYEYDLQIEIVDHLASSIEEQWKFDPQLSFGWALKNTLGKFDKNGLRKLERKIKKQLQRNFNGILWRYLLDFFKWPKLVITAAIFLTLFTVLNIAENNYRVLLFMSIPVSVFSLYYHYFLFPKKLDIKAGDHKTFMLLDYMELINKRIGAGVMLPYWIFIFSDGFVLRYSNAIWKEAVISIVLSVIAVLYYGYFFYLPQRIRDYFMKNYSQQAS